MEHDKCFLWLRTGFDSEVNGKDDCRLSQPGRSALMGSAEEFILSENTEKSKLTSGTTPPSLNQYDWSFYFLRCCARRKLEECLLGAFSSRPQLQKVCGLSSSAANANGDAFTKINISDPRAVAVHGSARKMNVSDTQRQIRRTPFPKKCTDAKSVALALRFLMVFSRVYDDIRSRGRRDSLYFLISPVSRATITLKCLS